MPNDGTDRAYGALTGTDADELKADEARNGAVHLASLTATKLADALIDPKLILAWLLGALGSPGYLIGALVPIREAGALLPQIALARVVERSERRRLFWSAGSAAQGLAALGVALSAVFLDGAVAGWAIVGCLAVLALARSACSVSYKDALARSLPKSRRGAVTGAAGAIAAAGGLSFGALLSFGVIPLEPAAVAGAIAVAAGLWLIGAALFTTLREEGDENGPDGSDAQNDGPSEGVVAPLADDTQLRRFVLARAMLTVTALAPPYFVMLSSAASGGAIGALGPLVVAAGAASIVSSYVWGRLSDRSSRLTLAIAAGLAAVTFAAVAAASFAGLGLGGAIGAAATLFVAQIAYEGVRAGRKMHLTDMVGDDARARYTALSNTVIGVALIGGGGFGALADAYGVGAVMAVFAVLSAFGAVVALTLEEVQKDAA